jgi:4-amino-4-deoxy-L-arabinose transferase-like glycosyltransferase
MTIKINQKKIEIKLTDFLYLAGVLFFIFYLVKDLNYNTAFVDEAIYATVGEEYLRKIFWENAISWMGGSYMYPVMSALVNRHYGLSGVRLLSMMFILFTGIVVSRIAKNIGGKWAGVIALYLFLFTGITLDLAQIGTYDAPSVAFMAVSLYFAIISRKKRNPLLAILLSGLFMSLAIITKYVAVLFVGAIGLIIFVKNKRLDFNGVIFWLLTLSFFLVWYLGVYGKEVYSFFIGGNSFQPAKFSELIKAILSSVGIFTLPLFISIIYVLRKKDTRKKELVLFMVLGGLLPILYHITFLNIRSIWKHMVFVLVFWVPVSSWIFVKVLNFINYTIKKYVFFENSFQLISVIGIIFALSYYWFSFSDHWRFQRSWPSATKVIEYLQTHKKPNDKVFAEASTIYKYHLFEGFEDPALWSSTWYLEYNGATGEAAMKQAIADKMFSFVILNNYYTSYIDSELRPTLYENYKITFVDTYKISGAYNNITEVWEPK